MFFQEILDFPASYSFKNESYYPKSMCVEFYDPNLTYNQLGLNSKLNLVAIIDLLESNPYRSLIFVTELYIFDSKCVFFQEIFDFPVSYSFKNVSHYSKNMCVEFYDPKLPN